MPLETLQRLGISLAIGLMVGVERGWDSRDLEEGSRTAGLRTFTMIGLLGGVAALVGQALGSWAFAAIAIPFAGAFILFKHREQVADNDFSVTAIVAAILVFALGALAIVGDAILAAAAAVVLTGLLAFKSGLHALLDRLTWAELRSALILLAMSIVVLPVLPNRGFGPYEALNPHELWLLTIVLAGVSYAGYAAIRIFGSHKGLLLAAVAGALVSSTAVTFYVSRLNRSAPNPMANAGAGVIAGAVMVARIGGIAAALSPPLFQRLVWPLASFGVVSVALGMLGWWRGHKAQTQAEDLPEHMRTPFDLSVVVKLALVLGAVTVAAKVLTVLYGAAGLLPLAAIAGLADVDALTLATSRMAAQGLSLDIAAAAVLLAAATDTLSKTAIAFAIGGRRMGLLFGGASLLASIAAAAMLFLV